MAGYGEGFSTQEPVAEERHDVGGRKRDSKDTGKQGKRRRSCPVYFGVKSYLHQFYDDGNSFKDPSLYEDDDHQYLLQPDHRRRRCAPLWWKIFMWIGVTLLLFGVIGILVGYLVPPRHVLIAHGPGLSSSSSSSASSSSAAAASSSSDKAEEDYSDTAYIDERAQAYNTTLDMSKLIGLILFCIGGVTLAMALLFPSFLAHYCLDEDFHGDAGDLRDVTGVKGYSDVAASPGQQAAIPVSSKVKEVQPSKKPGQQMLAHLPKAGDVEGASGGDSRNP